METPDREQSVLVQGIGDAFGLGQPANRLTEAVRLVCGGTFALSDEKGDMSSPTSHGVFHRDRRVVSRMELLVNGSPTEALAANAVSARHACFVLRMPAVDSSEASVVIVRNRYLDDGLHEEFEVRNYGARPVELLLEVRTDADFVDVTKIKTLARSNGGVAVERRVEANSVLRIDAGTDGRRGTEFEARPVPDRMFRSGPMYLVSLEPGEVWKMCLNIVPSDAAGSLMDCASVRDGTNRLARRAIAWRERFPTIRSGWSALETLYERGVEDLTLLLSEDLEGDGDLVVAAGLPWFMTLFGRDSIITSLMTLPFDRELPLGVLRSLARWQGRTVDDRTGEQPGKILHEVRDGELAEERGRIYYGSVDATPLFIVLAAEAWKWGAPWDEIAPLLPNVRRALDWMGTYGDPDGDGYLAYVSHGRPGLRNQGWKDSWDGIQFADGRLPAGPIALSEVQGYKYMALVDAATLMDADGDPVRAQALRDEAGRFARRFRRDFWMEDAAYPALALDGDRRRVDALTSNPAHLLWTGILSQEQASCVARTLVSSPMFSGWGLRTLASSNAGYRPVSYHSGSVWPHDTVIAAGGLARMGFVDEALTLIRGLMDAAPYFSFRLPELFSGFSRRAFGFPVGYPPTCSPQAWSGGSVLLLVRILLGLRADLPGGSLLVDPILPPDARPFEMLNVNLAPGTLSLRIETDGTLEILDAPRGVRVDAPADPRHRLSAS